VAAVALRTRPSRDAKIDRAVPGIGVDEIDACAIRIRQPNDEVIPDEARERGQQMASLDCKDADIDPEEKR